MLCRPLRFISPHLPARRLLSMASTTPPLAVSILPCPHELEPFIAREFNAHYVSVHGVDAGYEEVTLELRSDDDGQLVACLAGESFWGGMTVARLIVAPNARAAGCGSRLLTTAMAISRSRGDALIALESLDFQAPGFYLKHGFSLDFKRHDLTCPGALNYLSRALREGDADDVHVDAIPTLSRPVALPPYTLRRVALSSAHSEWMSAQFKSHALGAIGMSSGLTSWRFLAIPASLTHAAATEVVIPRDCDEAHVLGLVEGKIFFGTCFISLLIVAAQHRGRGTGSALLARAVQHAKSMRCLSVCVETFDFQAPALYEKAGFKLDFVRPGWKHGAKLHYYRMMLPKESSSE